MQSIHTSGLREIEKIIEGGFPGCRCRIEVNQPRLEQSEAEKLICIPVLLNGNIEGGFIYVQGLTNIEDKKPLFDLAIISVRNILENAKSLSEFEDLIAVSAHELKNSTACLQLQNDLFLQKIENGEITKTVDYKNAALNFDKHIKRLSKFISTIVDSMQTREFGLILKPESFKLDELVESIVSRVGDYVRVCGSTIETKFYGSMQVNLDKIRIEQVINNIIINACKHAPRSVIKVCVVGENGNIKISISDTGAGIRPEHADKIFERFVRVNSQTGEPGLGLGLYIASEIVRAHRGNLRLGKNEGRGAEFIIEIPRSISKNSL